MVNRARRRSRSLRELRPRNGTPLFGAAEQAFDEIKSGYDPTRINAVILLTDGINEDGDPADDGAQFKALTNKLRAGSEGEAATPVRFSLDRKMDGALAPFAVAQARGMYRTEGLDVRALQDYYAAVSEAKAQSPEPRA